MPEKYGVRLDSGDLAYLSKKARKMLDEAGFTEAKITASSDLDEHVISSLNLQGAKIDSWGVGTRLITSKDCPSFGGVYKLSAIKKDGKFIPRMKLSENQWKITNPGNKKIYRVYENDSGKVKADIIALDGELFETDKTLLLFDPVATWKKTYLKPNSYTLRELLVPIFIKGKCVYTSPSVMEIRKYCTKEQNTLWDECRRLVNPHNVYVDLSSKLYELKTQLLNNYNNH
jgi:nicotinate phosphoribosyltransferase